MEIRIIGVGGGTGSGKSTFADNLKQRLSEYQSVDIISLDSYYLDRSNIPIEERESINYDHPEALDFDLFGHHLLKIKNNEPIEIPIYDFKSHVRLTNTRTFAAAPIIIVEGILIYHCEHIRNCFDYKIFIDVPQDLRLLRRLNRDMLERGRTLESIVSQYLNSVREMDVKFVMPTKSFADFIVPYGGLNNKALDLIVRAISLP
jgi:uridine kinase